MIAQIMRFIACPLALVAALSGCAPSQDSHLSPPDLVLHNAKIWTGQDDPRWAEWVTIRRDRIEAIGSGSSHPEAARSLDLGGRLVVPGFNDAHVHFAQAGGLLLGVNLLDVNDDGSFRERIEEAAGRLPEGSWITGGDWGAYEAWALGSEGKKSGRSSYAPSRALIDPVTPPHPVLVTRYDRKVGLANDLALREMGLTSATGLLRGEQLEDALSRIPEKSFERRLAESRRALEECRRWGVTTVHDMSPLDQLDVYARLRKQGELTSRIHFSPSRLSDYEMMIEKGWTIGSGDPWVRFGTIKTHIDGIMGPERPASSSRTMTTPPTGPAGAAAGASSRATSASSNGC